MKHLLFSLLLFASAAYGQPLTITKGGTYSGAFLSTDPNKPAIWVMTGEPVIIQNFYAEGVGDVVIKTNGGSNLTLLNGTIKAAFPLTGYQYSRAIDNYQPTYFKMEYVTCDHTGGVRVQGWRGISDSDFILRNCKILNTDRRKWDGTAGNSRAAIQLMNMSSNLKHAVICNNEIINEPGKSWVEDCINIYNVANADLKIFNNLIYGNLPIPIDAKTSGAAITMDGNNTTEETITSFVEVFGNYIIGTANAAMNIPTGHDIYYHSNIIVSAALSGTTKLYNFWAGVCEWNDHKLAPGVMHGNRIEDNLIGYRHWDNKNNRQDENNTSVNLMARGRNTYRSEPVSLDKEAAELAYWKEDLRKNNIAIGNQSPLPPVVVPPSTPAAEKVYVYIHDTVKTIIRDTVERVVPVIKLVHDTITRTDTIWMVPGPYAPQNYPPLKWPLGVTTTTRIVSPMKKDIAD